MTVDTLVEDSPVLEDEREAGRPLILLEATQRQVLVVFMAAALVAVAVPYPVTKVVLGFALALYWAKLLFELDERFVGMFVLFLPTLQLAPLEALGVPGLNWQTVFLIIFVGATVSAAPPPMRLAVPTWIGYFSLLLVLGGAHGWLTDQRLLWPQLVVVKNWLFPFSLFLLGRRLVKNPQQLWFLVLCTAIVSFGLGLHGLRDGVTTGNLLTNRPAGLLTGQPNLFAGYLAMHALLQLFVSRTPELSRGARVFMAASAFLMVVTLLFTLSRGAWMAFALAGVLVGLATNRGVVVLLVLVILVGVRWAPEEAVTRADLTLTAVEQSGDSTLEEALDNSAALRIIQWKSLPTLMLDSPIWGTGLGSYAERLGVHTGIYRSAHATMVQIGTEMGALGLIGYLGLFGAAVMVCARRARAAARGTFIRHTGLGLLAATVCLFLADFSGTRFPTHTVTTYYWLLLGSFLGTTDHAAVLTVAAEGEDV